MRRRRALKIGVALGKPGQQNDLGSHLICRRNVTTSTVSRSLTCSLPARSLPTRTSLGIAVGDGVVERLIGVSAQDDGDLGAHVLTLRRALVCFSVTPRSDGRRSRATATPRIRSAWPRNNGLHAKQHRSTRKRDSGLRMALQALACYLHVNGEQWQTMANPLATPGDNSAMHWEALQLALRQQDSHRVTLPGQYAKWTGGKAGGDGER